MGCAGGEAGKARQPGGRGSGVAKLTNSHWLSLALRVVAVSLRWLSSADRRFARLPVLYSLAWCLRTPQNGSSGKAGVLLLELHLVLRHLKMFPDDPR